MTLYRFAKPRLAWLQQQADVIPGSLSARDLYTLYPSLTSVPPHQPCSQASGYLRARPVCESKQTTGGPLLSRKRKLTAVCSH